MVTAETPLPNPHAAAVLEHTLAWGRDCGIETLLDPKTVTALANISVDVVAYIGGEELDLEGYKRFAAEVAWFFWYDGWSDEEFGKSAKAADSQESETPKAAARPREFFEVIEQMDAILEHPESAEQSPNPYIKMLGTIALGNKANVSPWQFEYWKEWMCAYRDGLAQEVQYIDSDSAPELEEFIALRQKTGAVHAVTLAAAAAVGLRLSEESWEHPDLQRARELTSHNVARYNDIVSYDDEAAKGRANLSWVTKLRIKQQTTGKPREDQGNESSQAREAREVREAKAEALRLCANEEAEIRAIRERLQKSGADVRILRYIDVALLGWIDGYRNYVADNMAPERYQVADEHEN